MIKRLIMLMTVLPLILVYGCSGISELSKSSSPEVPQIIRKAEISSEWQVYQMNVEVTGDRESLILLRLTDGDRVDGYFYLEKGSNIDFSIAGNSLIYKSEARGESKKIASDRFSFSATRAQGSTYTLSFRNVDGGEDQTKVIAFLEIICPIGGSVFTPLETE